MAIFYLNRFSDENIHSQWMRHLQSNAYVDDIDEIVSENRRELQDTFQNASAEQTRAFTKVCGSIDDGFKEVSGHLKNINFNISELRGEINSMASMLDWKLSLMIEEQRLTNQLLGQISQLLRIPDSQKQRVYFIEQGLKYLKNAILEGIRSAFYDDSLDSFKEAEKIERKDYITLNRIGQIYLYSEKYLNFPLAEKYFLKSAREAFAEANAGGTTVSNHFKPTNSETKIYSENPFKAEAAEAYIYAARTCYLQKKFTEASEYAAKAYNLVPEFVEAGFEQAKYLSVNNKVSEAVNVLESVIDKDRFFSIKTLSDPDLSLKQPILDLLETLQQKALQKANDGLNECKRLMCLESSAKSIIGEIENNILKNNFLSAMKSLDLIKAEYRLPFETIGINGYVNHPLLNYYHKSLEGETSKNQTPPKLKLLEFLELENGERERAKIYFRTTNEAQKNRALIGALKGAGIGFLVALIPSAIFPSSTLIVMLICMGVGAYFHYSITE